MSRIELCLSLCRVLEVGIWLLGLALLLKLGLLFGGEELVELVLR